MGRVKQQKTIEAKAKLEKYFAENKAPITTKMLIDDLEIDLVYSTVNIILKELEKEDKIEKNHCNWWMAKQKVDIKSKFNGLPVRTESDLQMMMR